MKTAATKSQTHDAFNQEDPIKTNISNLLLPYCHPGPLGVLGFNSGQNAMERFETGKRNLSIKWASRQM